MGKYSDREKLAAAKDYCSGHQGLRQVAHRHGVNVASLRKWAAAYRVHGAKGVRDRERKYFSADFKLKVLGRMRREMLSYRQVAALFDIRNRDIIAVWERAYAEGGVAALQPHWLKRRSVMEKQTDQKSAGEDPDEASRTRQELLEELQQLRAENAYLKKLKALTHPDQRTAHGKKPKP
jgi:transposase